MERHAQAADTIALLRSQLLQVTMRHLRDSPVLQLCSGHVLPSASHLCSSSAVVLQPGQHAGFTWPVQQHASCKLTEPNMHCTQAGLEPALGGSPGESGPASGCTRSVSTDSSADFAALAADAALVAHDLLAAEGCSGMAAEDTPAAGGRASAAAEQVTAAEAQLLAALRAEHTALQTQHCVLVRKHSMVCADRERLLAHVAQLDGAVQAALADAGAARTSAQQV